VPHPSQREGALPSTPRRKCCISLDISISRTDGYGRSREARMAEAVAERRATRRFALQLAIALERGNGDAPLHYETRDLSAGGISFYSQAAIPKHSEIHFTMTVPPEITLTECMNVRCNGRIVRVVRDNGGLCIAAAINRYEFLGAASNPLWTVPR
jgi:hypothetical protein